MSPGDEAVRPHEDRAVGCDLAVTDPGAARVGEVAVEVADPQCVEREVLLGGELSGSLTPGFSVFPAMSRKRPGGTTSLIAQRLPCWSSSQAWGRGAPGRVEG